MFFSNSKFKIQNSKFKIIVFSSQQSVPYFFAGIKKDTREESSECKIQNSKFKIIVFSSQLLTSSRGLKKIPERRVLNAKFKIQNYLSDVTGSLFSNPENIKAPNALKVYKAYGTNFQHSILQR